MKGDPWPKRNLTIVLLYLWTPFGESFQLHYLPLNKDIISGKFEQDWTLMESDQDKLVI